MMRFSSFALSALLLSATSASADVNVTASIKPLHSLVAAVMQGVNTPSLLLDGYNSPHTYSLKPSDVEKLQKADVVFWIGHELEAFLEKPLQTLSQDAVQVALINSPRIKTLPLRENENAEHQDHDEHGPDPHIWLDPENAKAMLEHVAETLSKADPSNAEIYRTNAENQAIKIDALARSIKATLAPARGKGFIVFHDAYQYFEHRFDLKSSGSISVHPENPPGAKQIVAIRKTISDNSIQCVFAEPQFDNKLITVVTEGTKAKSATLDPIGAVLTPGPALYGELLQNLAEYFASCMQ